MKRGSKGMLFATAAAGLFLSGAVVAQATDKAADDKVHCAGVNACKGQGACAGGGHSCAGKNGCKGQGWVDASKEECAKKGGKVVEPKE